MTTVVLGLGSNVACHGMCPEEILRAACGVLAVRLGGFRASSVHRTRPMYRQDQADFYNLVCVGAWGGTAAELLAWTQGVEADFGRDRTREMRNGPRTLDIDIEFFGDRQIHTPELTVPHPRILERPFVIKPLLEILANTADD